MRDCAATRSERGGGAAGAAVAPLLVLALLAGACASVPRSPVWAEGLGYRPDELFPVEVGKYGWPFVPVVLDGREVELLFDTGNMTGLAVAPALARRLGLPQVDEWTSLDADGSVRGRLRVFQAGEVRAFGTRWKEERAHEMESDDLPGLVGPRFLRDRRFTLDYGRGVLAVSASALPPSFSGGDVLPLVPSKRYEGMLVVEGSVNGRRALIQLDTGKSRTCVDPGFAAVLELPKSRDGYRIDEIRLGSFLFAVPNAKAVGFRGIGEDLPSAIVVGVGSDVLREVILTVDYPGQRALLSR